MDQPSGSNPPSGLNPPPGLSPPSPFDEAIPNIEALNPYARLEGQLVATQECIPLDHAITVYFSWLGADAATIQQLVYFKSALAQSGFSPTPVRGCEGDFIRPCDRSRQEKIIRFLKDLSQIEPYKIELTDENVGKYIVSGLTQVDHLQLIVSLPRNLFQVIKGLDQVGFNLSIQG